MVSRKHHSQHAAFSGSLQTSMGPSCAARLELSLEEVPSTCALEQVIVVHLASPAPCHHSGWGQVLSGVGLDHTVDYIYAVKRIDEVHAEGGKVCSLKTCV